MDFKKVERMSVKVSCRDRLVLCFFCNHEAHALISGLSSLTQLL